MRWFVALTVVGLVAWLFADVFLLGGIPGFRDAGHFYYPLLRFTGQQWSAGRVPLWNPYENLGAPLAANPTTAAFYPGLVLFILPLPSSVAYNAYLLGHLLLAAAGAYALARRGDATVPAAGLAALAYAAGGSVLFQYTNAVYLVGAAWLPLALLAAERMLAGRDLRSAALLGVVLAMMVLGGDPQMAYHAGILAALGALLLGGQRVREPVGRGQALLQSRFTLLAVAATVGVGLSAVQVVPSLEYSRTSDRTVTAAARSLYEVPRALAGGAPARGVADGILCRHVDPHSHHASVYSYSVGPWRWGELLWPNVGGRQFPEHRRWFDAIPAEGRVWVPSLYVGLLPALLGLAALRFRKGDGRRRWLSWAFLLAVLASLGWYGPMWLVREAVRWTGVDTGGWPGHPVGGVYWWMTVVLPGYIQFRYPGKWLVVASLALSLLAARGWDDVVGRPAGRLPRVLAGLAALSAVLFLAMLIARPWWNERLAGVPADMVFGPFDAAGAGADVLAALGQTAVVGAVLAWLLGPGRSKFSPQCLPAVLLLLTALDLGWANRWMVAVVPDPAQASKRLSQNVAQPPSAVQNSLHGRGRPCYEMGYGIGSKSLASVFASPGRRIPATHDRVRVYRPGYGTFPPWAKRSSPERVREVAAWERAVFWPNYNIEDRIGVLPVAGTMMPRDLWGVLTSLDPPALRGALDVMAVTHAILPEGRRFEDGCRLPCAPGSQWGGQFAVWANRRGAPRTWVVHQVRRLPPMESKFPPGGPIDPALLARRTREVFAPEGAARDFQQEAVVETASPPRGAGQGRGGEALPGPVDSSSRIVAEGADWVELEAKLGRPGLVVLADTFDPGWQLTVSRAGEGGRPAPVLRTNRLLRGAWLEAGEYRLVYRYRPTSVLVGGSLSAAAWLALAAAAWFGSRRVRANAPVFVR